MPAIPQHLDFLFADRPLLPGENAEQYEALLRIIIQQVKPSDVIEAIWVKDIVDLVWEAKRLRRWRSQILNQGRLEAGTALILPVIENENHNPFTSKSEHQREATTLAFGWLQNSKTETAAMERMLQARGLTPADVTAQAFQLRLSEVERVERMIASTDHRRDTLLREVERRRAGFSQQLRNAAAEVIDLDSPAHEAGATLTAPI
ncbi:hypothetical protein AEGHOMDF_5431 [Methylobacterium soli]|nr:hypothetical protein AEGHOMDF_5431 [Methylobacterium soli]